jgi:hypothetical protein
VTSQVKALLATVGEDIPDNFLPCDVSNKIQSLKLEKSCGFDDIPNGFVWHLPRRPIVPLTHLFNPWFRLGHFMAPWKEAKIITVLKPNKNPKFSPDIRPVGILSTTDKLLEKIIL